MKGIHIVRNESVSGHHSEKHRVSAQEQWIAAKEPEFCVPNIHTFVKMRYVGDNRRTHTIKKVLC